MWWTSIVRNGDFVRCYKRGKAFVHPFVVLYVNKNKAKGTRVGITASKKIGNAVVRNRARRVIRHALKEVLPKDAGSLDLIFVARGQTAKQKSGKLEKVLQMLLQKAGVKTLKAKEDMP